MPLTARHQTRQRQSRRHRLARQHPAQIEPKSNPRSTPEATPQNPNSSRRLDLSALRPPSTTRCSAPLRTGSSYGPLGPPSSATHAVSCGAIRFGYRLSSGVMFQAFKVNVNFALRAGPSSERSSRCRVGVGLVVVVGLGWVGVLSSSVTRRASETRRRRKRRPGGVGCRRALCVAACASVGFPIVLRMPDDERTPARPWSLTCGPARATGPGGAQGNDAPCNTAPGFPSR